ncbi:MAG: FHA domain-containing protein, partial [Myxococcota bacterium]
MSDDDERTTNPGKTVITVIGPPPKGEIVPEGACLVVIYGDDLGRRIQLSHAPIVVGRSSKCDLQIDQESVSRNHCRISFDGARYQMTDLGSTNGTYVNDALFERSSLRD